ncbi:hypothetical protein NERG_02752 [Nematocida ausubeli]|uniref:Uncharacterized protein n=1 Tax=Nematocida ausubeli (strain ATCC PRA-371 / ERTm2) TaxID=1913371 RepID=H8ZGN1_NEMA1|nr:hypothetical protein NERG_02752 [Nematocida ausubeli]
MYIIHIHFCGTRTLESHKTATDCPTSSTGLSYLAASLSCKLLCSLTLQSACCFWLCLWLCAPECALLCPLGFRELHHRCARDALYIRNKEHNKENQYGSHRGRPRALKDCVRAVRAPPHNHVNQV